MPILRRRIRNTQIRGSVFGLKQVRFEQSKLSTNYNIENTNSWSESDYYSYFAGGAGLAAPLPTSGTCSLYRLDLTTETFVSPPANQLGRAYWGMTGTAGDLYGYFMGGATPVVTTVKRVDYLTDTITTPATVCPNGYAAASAQDSNCAFIAGGSSTASPSGTSALGTVNKFDYSIDTIINTGGVIGGNYPDDPSAGNTRAYHGAASSRSYGYFMGGVGNSPTPTPTGPVPATGDLFTISRLDLKTGTSNIGDFAPGGGGGGTSTCQTNSYAYSNSLASRARLDFYNDTASSFPSPPISAGSRAAGSTNNFGYFFAGETVLSTPTTSPILTSRAERINFSTDTPSSSGNFIGGALKNVGYFSVGGRKIKIAWQPQVSLGYGYNYNGNTPALTSIIDRLSFTNETNVFISSRFPSASARSQGVASYPAGSYIYIAGGTPPISCSIVRHDFSDDSISVRPSKLPAARYGLAGLSSPTNGYFGGGYFTPPVTYSCTIYRMSFSTETVTLPGSNLPTGLLESGSFQSPTLGFICGGQIPGGYSCTIHKITFSTDTVSLPGKNISIASSKIACVESGTYGYMAGGERTGQTLPFISVTYNTIHRMDFATETVSTTPQALPRTYGFRGAGGMSAPSHGYFAGGVTNSAPGAAYISNIYKMSFTTETNSDLPVKLTRSRYTSAAGSTVG